MTISGLTRQKLARALGSQSDASSICDLLDSGEVGTARDSAIRRLSYALGSQSAATAVEASLESATDVTSDVLRRMAVVLGSSFAAEEIFLAINAISATLDPPSGSSIWLKAEMESYVNGENVTQWSDRSGNGRHATAASNYPTFATGANGSKPAILFNGSNQGFTLSRTGSGSAYTIAGIVKPTVNALRVWWQNGINPYIGLNSNNRPNFNYGSTLNTQSTDIWQNWMPIVVRANGTSGELFVGKTRSAIGSITSAALSVAGLGNLAGFYWQGYMQEIIAYESALSDGDLEALIDYLHQESQLSDKVIVTCDGDSLTYGLGVTTPYPTLLQTALGSGFTVLNYGVTSQSIVDTSGAGNAAGYMNSDASAQVWQHGTRVGGKNVVVAWGGTNDIYFGRTGEQAASDFATYCTNARNQGAFVIAINMIARRTDLGSWSDAKQSAFNSAFSSNASSYSDAQIDAAAMFPDETDLTYFQADQVHLNDTGTQLIAAAVYAAINSNRSSIV